MRSPGHQKWPDHRVEEKHLADEVTVEIDGKVIADSHDVIQVNEDENPPRHYFPRSDVKMDALEPSSTTSQCPYKGTARYFNLKVGDRTIPDAAWSYEQPFDEHKALQNRLAFYDDTIRDIHLHTPH